MALSLRRAKILVTLGPACYSKQGIDNLIRAGANGFRINCSHSGAEIRKILVERIRHARRSKYIPVMFDLPGHKIRVTGTSAEPLKVSKSEQIYLLADGASTGGKWACIGITKFPDNLTAGDAVLLGDGAVELEVIAAESHKVLCRSASGGLVKKGQGVVFVGKGYTEIGLTKEDIECIRQAAELDVDWIAQSMVSSVDDVMRCRQVMDEVSCRAGLIVKLELPEAVNQVDQILNICDGVMVARGDLGLQMRIEQIPALQKRIILATRRKQKLGIVATQMLESMVENPSPTRAEATDVANAVWDGADVLMLSEETAVGKYPIYAVKTMSKLIEEAEKYRQNYLSFAEYDYLDEASAVARAAVALADAAHAKLIVAFTESGATGQRLSCMRPPVPLLAYTTSERTMRKVSLYWGVNARLYKRYRTTGSMIAAAERDLIKMGMAMPNDLIVVVSGSPGVVGSTDTVKMHRLKYVV